MSAPDVFLSGEMPHIDPAFLSIHGELTVEQLLKKQLESQINHIKQISQQQIDQLKAEFKQEKLKLINDMLSSH
jgi:hypothetical protein